MGHHLDHLMANQMDWLLDFWKGCQMEPQWGSLKESRKGCHLDSQTGHLLVQNWERSLGHWLEIDLD